MSQRVGLTTTVPVEVLLAAGITPTDLNNVFITANDRDELVTRAELEGYPQNVCGWIKGIYSTVLSRGIGKIVAVTQGDCSQTHAMIETLQAAGVEVFPFSYPYDRDRELLKLQMQRMMDHFGTTWEAAEEARQALVPVRAQLAELDRLTWEEGRITGSENHTYLVSASDFSSDVEGFGRDLGNLLAQARRRSPDRATIRIGIIGVPPIMTNLYEVLEGLGVAVVYNEVQRQFAMVANEADDLLEQYALYTYPYDVFGRIEDINREIGRRRLDGIVHYVQTFCYRQIQDIMLKRRLAAPVLTIEGDRPTPVDARSRLRLEAFVESLQARRALSSPKNVE